MHTKYPRYLLNIILSVVSCFIFFQTLIFASFMIPSDSMSPELKEGDNVLVAKPVYGARLFNVFATLNLKQVKIYRFPGLANIERNDIIVFNNPYPEKGKALNMHILKYYVKRCVGLPGDSISIVNGFNKVNSFQGVLGNYESQKLLSKTEAHHIHQNVYGALPFDSLAQWNIKDFGPMYIPAKGDSVEMTRLNYLLYKRLIEWETGERLDFKENRTYLGNSECKGYRFKENYYFMAGDNVMNSSDSRYWGLVPEEYIVGKVWLIWKSVNPATGSFDWSRFMKIVN